MAFRTVIPNLELNTRIPCIDEQMLPDFGVIVRAGAGF
jgi:hypothetical protein